MSATTRRRQTELSAARKKKYLAASHKCPYCFSEDIEGGFVEIDADQAFQKISCLFCNKEWRDIYSLVDIEEVE
jgi:transcription elongation factor Elf1